MQAKKFLNILLLSICLICSLSSVKCDDSQSEIDYDTEDVHPVNKTFEEMVEEQKKTRLADTSKFYSFDEVLDIFFTVYS